MEYKVGDKRPRALVLGLGGMNAIGVARSLARNGIPVDGLHIGSMKAPINSGYFGRCEYTSPQRGFIELMQSFARARSQEKIVVFPTGDQSLFLLEEYGTDLEADFHMPFPPDVVLEGLLDKKGMLEHAKNAGFAVPASTYLSLLKGPRVADGIRLPVIVKPSNSIVGGKGDMHIVRTQEELDGLFATRSPDDVVQNYFDGDITDHVEVHTCNTSQGPVIVGMQQKLLPYMIGQVSKGAVTKSVWIPELVGPAKTLTTKLGFDALDINLVKDPQSGVYNCIEFNGRTSANLMLDTCAGRNLPAIIFRDRLGEDISDLCNEPIREGVVWMAENHALRIMQEEGQVASREDVMRWRSQAEVFAFFDPQDEGAYRDLLVRGKVLEL